MLTTPSRSSTGRLLRHEHARCRRYACIVIAAAISLTACGGAEKSEPVSEPDAVRFLEQASFGPTTDEVAAVQSMGYRNWIDRQLRLVSNQPSHLQVTDASAVARSASTPDATDVNYSWWTHAILDNAQLRQRIAYALSQIFVVSTNSDLGSRGRLVASYMDMLAKDATGTYRQLLEDVATHPAMGVYLSHMSNRKEDTTSGRVPDENFAREVMQLFSIGLYELNSDGSLKLTNGLPTETYSANDVKGLAKVFTGFSWNWPAAKSALVWWKCFWRATECKDAAQEITSMTGYTQEHSTSVKQFLGITVDAQATANPQLSLQLALDRLATHPNTAPFISRQLIQRLVTSNPSPTYVQDIASVFLSSGGNLGQVVSAILLHSEARTASTDPSAGKLREPVLRVTHLMRALPHTSDTLLAQQAQGSVSFYPIGDTDNPGTALSQTPMRSPSVFNFYRPGYKPPQTELAAQDLVSPEMQITTETTVIGYANFVAGILNSGWGKWNSVSSSYDVRFDFSNFDTAASQPDVLIDTLSRRLLGKVVDEEVRTAAITAISTMPSATASDRRKRSQAAALLIAVSPSFITQQ